MVTRHKNNKDKSYIGLTDNTFKTWYHGHTDSFRNEKYKNATALSSYIGMLKDKKSYSLNGESLTETNPEGRFVASVILKNSNQN